MNEEINDINTELSKYTALDLVNWISNLNADTYHQFVDIVMYDDGKDDIIINFDFTVLSTLFLQDQVRYKLVIRGHKLVIYDTVTLTDKVHRYFTEENKEEVQEHMNTLCELINKDDIIVGCLIWMITKK